MKDAYDILGVARTATPDEIKTSFRKLARERHPDADPKNPWAEDEFKELTAAYRVLSNPHERARYDRGEIDAEGAHIRRSQAGLRSHAKRQSGFSPFERFRQRAQRAGNLKIDGANVSYALKVEFVEAAAGAVKYVSMANGKRLKVSIPAGARNAQVLRLRGQGMPGVGGGKDGDALVEIEVRPHPVFKLEGKDVHLDLPVTLKEAVRGAKVSVPTIGGAVSMTVPGNSNTGTMLRLRGKGLKEDGSQGDQFVTLKIVLPNKSDSALSEFLQDWDAGDGEAMREDLVSTSVKTD